MLPLYLKNPQSDKPTPVRLRVYIDGKPHHYATGESVHPDGWDAQKQRCKVGKPYPLAYAMNTRLDRIVSQASQVVALFRIQGIVPEWPQFRAELDRLRGIETGETGTFWQYVHTFIQAAAAKQPKHNRNSIVTSYRQTEKILRQYETGTRLIDWGTFTKEWGERFTRWLLNKRGYSVNNAGKHIKTLKTWLNAAVLDGYAPNPQFKRYRVLTERTDEVYLTVEEIKRLEGLQLEGGRELVRDIFVFACYTGLRYVDYSAVTRQAVNGSRLHIYQSKTGHPVVIPLRPECMAILDKYGGKLPDAPENQTMNRTIKELCRLAGIDKANRVKTHTARRSFATNLYLSGFPATDIMRITGHKTEKSFLLYIRTAATDTADRLAEFWGL